MAGPLHHSQFHNVDQLYMGRKVASGFHGNRVRMPRRGLFVCSASPTGSSTLQDTPSFAWRDNVQAQGLAGAG